MPTPAPPTLRDCIQKVATGPEYSKDLTEAETCAALHQILDGADPVQAGVFLIALRMKRETPAENAGALQAILDVTERAQVDAEDVLDIADPYNGQARGLPVAAFLAPVLAACGLPAYVHGVEEVGPKFGVTHHRVLRAAGVEVDLAPADVAARLADPAIGWGYCDQSRFCAPLHRLVGLRRAIVKRPVLTTVEVLARPLAARRTHLLTGYVHKAYPPVYAALARQAGFDNAAIVRGVEGGVIPSLQQPARVYVYRERGPEEALLADPRELGIDQGERCLPLPQDLPPATPGPDGVAAPFDTAVAAAAAAAAGLAALDGKPGAARDSLVYGAAIALHVAGHHADLTQGARRVREVLDSGAARARFEAGAARSAPGMTSTHRRNAR